MPTNESPQAASSSEVILSLRSRYRNTRVRKDSDTGDVFFGTWRPPPVEETRPPKIHRIKPDEIYNPGLIAYREYGDVNFFWAIAMRNNLLFPFIEVKTLLENNNVLLIPHIDDVMAAIQKSSPNAPPVR
jgi:hypothetical protein